MKKMTDEQKHQQIMKEMKATLILFGFVMIWHIGTAFALNGIDLLVYGMPLWFLVSVIGAFVIAVIGNMLLRIFVFEDFDLGEEMTESEQEGGGQK